ncbi:MAG: response regulator [Azonexus sp.]
MNKALLRQLKRTIGIADEVALSTYLETLRAHAANSDPALQGLLTGFGNFLERVDASYEQYDRDLELRTRSLEISSLELSGSNEKLRSELSNRENALGSLRDAIQGLLPSNEGMTITLVEDNIETLSRRVAELVANSEKDRLALANQKFALDQHAIVSITDTNGTILYANDRFCEISGYQRHELIGQNHRIVKSGIHPPEIFRDMWGTISLGHVWHGEVCNRGKAGQLYWVSATIVPLLGPDGQPEQYIAIRTDISDRKRMEAELSEQLDLVEGLIEAIPLPVYIKDAEGRYLRLNRAFEIFIGIKREDFIGKTLYELLARDAARFHSEKDTELLARGGTQTYETIVHGHDRLSHNAIYRKAALTRRDGSIYGLLGTIIDITDRKKAEVEMQLAKEAAEAASRAKSDFLANMSHEIRTPMNGIIGMTDLALDTALTEEQREFLGIVKSSAESLLTIINDILDFSKIEAGKLLVEEISFDLHRVVAETLKTMALRAHEKRIELVFEIMPDVPRHVLGDPSRLRQILINLIGNSIKFTHEGEIAVRAELSPTIGKQPHIQFSVRDTGIGIATDKQQSIFEAFSQEDTSTTRRFGGTGLGLSISRRLVELMQGRIWLESEPGKGSTFFFSLELKTDSQPPEAGTSHIVLRGRHILVVDDNTTNCRILSSMLAHWDVKTTLADGGSTAIEILRKTPQAFDCILLDAHMPEMDGYELALNIRGPLAIMTPMIMLSSGALRGDGQRCQEVGISGYFSKPISSEELLAALCRVFDICRNENSVPSNQLVTRHALRELQRSLEVLLVEDHPVNQKLAIGLLQKWGHHPTLASNGQEALDILAIRNFNVVLMDMHMPLMGGVEATCAIRAREVAEGRPRTPIIAMTAAAMQSDKDACIAAGMDDYLAKPIRAKDLLEKLLAYGGNPEAEDKPAFDYGEALLQADLETVEIIADIFLETWGREIELLRIGVNNQDAPTVERTTHSLKGTLATFCAEPAKRVAADLEIRTRNKNLEGMTPDIDSLQREIQLLEPHIRAISIKGSR